MTAEEARKISKENNKDYIVENILETIQKVAYTGEFKVDIRGYGFSSTSYYANGLTGEQENIIREIENLGYKAEMHVEDRQFVDIFLRVSWE